MCCANNALFKKLIVLGGSGYFAQAEIKFIIAELLTVYYSCHPSLKNVLSDTLNNIFTDKKGSNSTMPKIKHNKVDVNVKNSLLKYKSTRPYIGTLKTHKPGSPLKPIVSFNNSPIYRTATFFSNILQMLCHNHCSIEDSLDIFGNLRVVIFEQIVALFHSI